jgi:Fe2+ transport system protein FeoA
LRPGVGVRVTHLNPDDTFQLEAGNTSILLGATAAAKIWVKPVEE